jgi:putative addiction module component (TIGR02574 family)
VIRWSKIAHNTEDAMSEAAEKLKPLLAALAADERAELAEYLLALNDGEGEEEKLTPEEWEVAWADEIDRRIDAAKAGKTISTPADEFMQRMKEKHG